MSTSSGRRARTAGRRDRAAGRLTDPRTGRPFSQLVVADVELDSGTLTVQEPLTPLAQPAQGVHALVWYHGVPLGEITVPGRPDDVLACLVEEARAQLLVPQREHLLHDALSTPGGLRRAREQGLASLPHPPDLAGPGPSVSVAVCTRDRPDALRRCLQSLSRLTRPVDEVLVVDNASQDDRTRQVAAQFPGVRCVQEPRRGLDWARNRALLEARSEVVAFTDDDVLVHPDWVGGLLRAFREEPTAVAVTGLVVPRELSTPAQVLFEATGGFGRGFRRKWFSAAVQDGAVAARQFGASGVAGTGANMALRRDQALALGGFDTALDVGTRTGGGGDLEMFFRLVASGGLLVYEPSAVVRHVHRPGMDLLLRQLRGNGTGAFSYFLGASRRYPLPEARQFRRMAVRFVVQHYVRGLLSAVTAPGRRPASLLLAEVAGACAAVLGSYYGRAQREAADELRAHSGSVLPPTRITRGTTRSDRPVNTRVRLDLAGDGPVHPDGQLPDPAAEQAHVEVLRHGRLEQDFVCMLHGSPLSPVRLRWCLVDELGTALLPADPS